MITARELRAHYSPLMRTTRSFARLGAVTVDATAAIKSFTRAYDSILTLRTMTAAQRRRQAKRMIREAVAAQRMGDRPQD